MLTMQPAVIPTVLIGGPLAILAMLFPPLFGGMLLVARRWTAALTVASLNSSLYLLYSWDWFHSWIKGTWWDSPATLWLLMTGMAGTGTLWAWRRRNATAEPLRRSESCFLWTMSLAMLGGVIYALVRQQSLLVFPWKGLLVLGSGAWAGTLNTLYRRCRQPSHASCPAEGLALSAMVVVALGLAIPLPRGMPELVNASGNPVRSGRVIWQFDPKERGTIVSSPVVAGDYVYVATASEDAFSNLYGVVYCIDRTTRRQVWAFNLNNKRQVKQIFSTPCVAGGRLYVGEGFHQDSGCKLYCLRADTGDFLWEKQTGSHTESSPHVAEGRVYFGAGDDGLYCLDAASGEEKWHYQNRLHIDADPVVVAGRVYGGGGVVGDAVYKRQGTFCLSAATGDEVWFRETTLPVLAAPAVVGDRLFIGMGNGNFSKSDDQPRGAVLCVEAATGRIVWEYAVADAVVTRPAVDGESLYFGSRDGYAYSIARADHTLRWKRFLGSPIVASPALAVGDGSGRRPQLVVAASEGPVCGLDPEQGEVLWSFDVSGGGRSRPQVYSSPAAAVERGGHRRVYIGAGIGNDVAFWPVLYCLEEEGDV